MNFVKKIKRELPISLELAKAHLRLGDYTGDDPLVTAKLEMAIGIAEDFTGRLIRPRGVVFHVLLNVGRTAINLPVRFHSVTAVSCLDKKLSIEDYELTSDGLKPQLLFLKPANLWGTKLTVEAEVGYSKDDLPPAIQAAILLLLGTLYDNESDHLVGRSVSELSLSAEKILQPWRILPYGDV